ncbi:MAG: phage tail protein [Kouleothrix sp.]|nr:phage tail protein [Kouleothrix sp.]
MTNPDPLVSAFFTIEAGDHVKGAFRECSGLGSEHEIVEEKSSGPDGRPILKKIPGRMKYTDITLKRGITDAMDMWKWRKLVEDGNVKDARYSLMIRMHAADGKVIARWNLTNAWPSKLTGPTANATNNEIGVEELVIVHEGYKRVE